MSKFIFLLALAVITARPALSAEPQQVGSWWIGVSDEGGPYMFVANDSGSYFGKWCDAEVGSCFWMLVTKTSCEPEAKAPLLINAEKFALAPTSTCAGNVTINNDTVYRSVIHEPDNLDRAVLDGTSIAFAVAIEGGQFRVIRFTYSRFAEAHQRLKSLTAKMKPKGTKDQTM